MKDSIALFLVILALVAAVVVATARTIVPSIAYSDGSGWVVTAPRADQTGYAALPRPFAPDRRDFLSVVSGVAFVALLVVSAVFAAYTIRIGYRGERRARDVAQRPSSARPRNVA